MTKNSRLSGGSSLSGSTLYVNTEKEGETLEKLTQIWESIRNAFTNGNLVTNGLEPYYIYISRIALVLLAVFIVVRCGKSLLRGKTEMETWAYITLPNGARLPVHHWENLIGRAKSCDIVLNYPTVSRQHGALMRDDKGNWTIIDINSKGGITVNGKNVDGSSPVKMGDIINLGGVDIVLAELSEEELREQVAARTKPGREISPSFTLWLLTVFQVLLVLQLCMTKQPEYVKDILISFAGLCIVMWLSFIVTRAMRRTGFEVETLAFFLSTLGFSVCASSAPESMYKQLGLFTAGVVLFFVLCWILRDLDMAKKMRWPIAAAGIAFLAFNIVFGSRIYGAQNWIRIGSISIQPSEFVKIAFIFGGTATLDRMFARRNLVMFIGFAAACVGALALMGDFGTAAIFFIAFLVIAFLRSGDIATIALSITGAVFAGILALRFKPYIASRFATWGHAWQYASEGGFQQTRTMSAAASGGLLGSGAGNGWLKGIVADTDLVFGVVCEELGLIIALAAIASVVILAIFTVKSVSTSRSCFYITAACAAVSMYVFQIILNVFGSVDILPLTGVTFPFVSKGGSSLIACWCLLAFIKANDTRQNASLAIKLRLKRKMKNTSGEAAYYEPKDAADFEYGNGEYNGYEGEYYGDGFDDEDWSDDE